MKHFNGYIKSNIDLPSTVGNLVTNKSFDLVYKFFLNAINNRHSFFYDQLLKLLPPELQSRPFHTELMLSLREGPQDIDQEGIWHDDGSRDLIFSLSLSQESEIIVGGELFLRRKSNKEAVIKVKPAPFGTIFLFNTGKRGWEHKVSRVTIGNRLVLVGWLTIM